VGRVGVHNADGGGFCQERGRDLAVMYKDGTDRDFAGGGCGAGFGDRSWDEIGCRISTVLGEVIRPQSSEAVHMHEACDPIAGPLQIHIQTATKT